MVWMARMAWPRRVAVLGAIVATAGLALGGLSIALGFESGAPTTVVVGSPRGYAPGERVDARRRGQSSVELPSEPKELWRRELAGGLELPPLVDHQGEIVAALVSPDVVRLDKDGKQLWRVQLGSLPAIVPPVLTSDGSTALLSGDGTLWSVSAGGAVRFSTDLMMRTRRAAAAPLARANGSVVVAGDTDLAVVGADGVVRARATLPNRAVGGLIGWRRGVLAVTQDGVVYHWKSPKAPRKLGELGGPVTGGVVLTNARTVVGVIEADRVVALDLLSGNVTLVISAETAIAELEGPTTLDPRGELLVTSAYGELFGIDPHGAVARRVALEPLPTLSGDAGAPLFRRMDARPSPPLIVDAKGRVAFMRNSGKLGLVVSDDAVIEVTLRLCARPHAVLPAGPKRIIAACRSGTLAMFGEE
jgi:hypothetical protein